MKRFVSFMVRRIIECVITILVVLVINFILIHSAPGDPARIMAGEWATPEIIEATRARYGLDKPLYEQLIIYLTGIFRGDFGYSLTYHKPVLEIIGNRIPNTLILVLPVLIIGIPLGILLGTYCARKFQSKVDIIMQGLSFMLYSVPTFWVGLVFIQIFTMRLNWFPMLGGGLTPIGDKAIPEYLLDLLWHLAPPLISLVIVWTIPEFLRLARASVLEVMNEEYITALKCVGMKEETIFKHALRNALLPSVTLIGITIAQVFMGSVLVETVFTWPGLGLLLLESIRARDYPLLMGMFLIVSIAVTIAFLITDLLYAYLDPRVTYT